MKLDPGQQSAVDGAVKFARDPDRKVMRIFGPAGTGKTTIARTISENLKAEGKKVAFAAYTGKAASVLRRKGCEGATTVHKLFFKSFPKSGTKLADLRVKLLHAERALAQEPGNQERRNDVSRLTKAVFDEERNLSSPKFHLNMLGDAARADVVIIDEVSMIGERMGAEMMSLAKKIIVTGDPYQLQPIGDGGYFTSQRPDIMLETVHRQGADNPILELATNLRRGRGWRLGDYGPNCRVIRADDPRRTELCLAADQMIVGRNETRNAANEKHRLLRKIDSKYPIPGERVVARRNNHEMGILNGTMWNVVSTKGLTELGSIDMVLDSLDDATIKGLPVDANPDVLLGGEVPRFIEEDDPLCFQLGYAVTCHVSQGSEWPKGYVYDESSCFGRQAPNWLYTAVTRFSEDLTLVVGKS